jgi:diguanylate cyclase (GGDEF)-like protein
MKEVSARTLSAYYLIALTIIGGLSIGFHFVVERELHDGRSASSLINLSGRQRMLSQRIAGMAAEYRLGVPYARGELVAATDSFEAGHERLLAEIKSNSATDKETTDLLALYADGSGSLNLASRNYIAQARRIAATPSDSPLLPDLLSMLFAQARSPLLKDLDHAVTIRQRGAELRVSRMQRIQYGILAIVLVTLVLEAFTIFKPMVQHIVSVTAELIALATTDPLTRAANRRSFMESGKTELERRSRTGRPLSLIAIDVDHFKSVNDRYGHAAGDAVLQTLSVTLMTELRSVDVLGRIGGEEFAILLPETALLQAAQVAERLRRAVEGMEVVHGDKSLRVTMSLGVVEVSPGITGLSEAMNKADAALYRAKASGRNCVISAETTVQVTETSALGLVPA